MKSGVYIITCKVGNKHYIGESIHVDVRIKEHLNALRGNYHPNQHLQSSWNKYGEQSFEYGILENCAENLLEALEHYWCTILNTHDRNYGFNIYPTSPNDIRRLSSETKEKISIVRKEQYRDPIRNPFYGKKHSEETKLKMSISGKGKNKSKWTEERRRKTLESRKINGNRRYKKVINVETGKVYNTIKEACEDTGIVYSTFYNYINGIYPKNRKNTNKTKLKLYAEI